MDSHEDPEVRIRELERSLSDVAGASELTSSSTELSSVHEVRAADGAHDGAYDRDYAPASPPATGSYGAPAAFGPPPTGAYGGAAPAPGLPPTASFGPSFNALPPTSSGATTIRWLVIGLMTLLTLGVFGGAAFWASNVFSDARSLINPSPDRPTISGGGNPFDQPSSRTPGSPSSRVIATNAPQDGPPAGGDYSVSGVGENKTIACNDGAISISGVSNQVVITGHCASVTVSGVQNVVTVDDAESISASGLSNHITYRSGSPDIENSGSSNIVEQG